MSLDGARDALRRGNLANVVSESQRCAEFSLKGALMALGVGPGQRPNPSPILLARLKKFPPELRERARGWAYTAEELERLHEMAVYGDPESRRTPKERFSDPAEAQRSLHDAETIYVGVKELRGCSLR